MIDIKELRVGSHVRIGGKRECITTIDALNGRIGINVYKEDERGDKYAFGYPLEQVEPIPITEELLEELGFEKVERNIFITPYTSFVRWEFEQRMPYGRPVYNVEVNPICDDVWSCNVLTSYGFGYRLQVKYLHELENFVYLVRKEEIEKLNGNDIQQ